MPRCGAAKHESGLSRCGDHRLAQMPGQDLNLRRGGSVPREELEAFHLEVNVERPERTGPELIRHYEGGHRDARHSGKTGMAHEHPVVDCKARDRAHHPGG
jgi:hypothetical protein